MTATTPIVKSIRAIPLAGHDSMLLNLNGAHGPYFTRNTLNDAKVLIEGQPIGAYKNLLKKIEKTFADRDSAGRGNQTFDLRTIIHVVTAYESTSLDLLGKHLNVNVASLLGGGQQRDEVEVLGYLFFVGDRKQTSVDYMTSPNSKHEWYQLRHEKALTPDAIQHLAEASYDRYGLKILTQRRCFTG